MHTPAIVEAKKEDVEIFYTPTFGYVKKLSTIKREPTICKFQEVGGSHETFEALLGDV